MTLDLCFKIYYYFYSRFSNKFVKQIYKGFLFVRPALLILLCVYNFFIEKRDLDKFIKKNEQFVKLQELHRQKIKQVKQFKAEQQL